MKTITMSDEDAEVLADIIQNAAARELGAIDARHHYTEADLDMFRKRARLAHDAVDILRAKPVCETCRGSGMVSYGPWGSRPPRKTCPDCKGTKVAS